MADEITAASDVEFDLFNSQLQPRFVNEISYAVVGSRADQNERAGTLNSEMAVIVQDRLAHAEKLAAQGKGKPALAQLDSIFASLQTMPDQELLVEDVLELRATIG